MNDGNGVMSRSVARRIEAMSPGEMADRVRGAESLQEGLEYAYEVMELRAEKAEKERDEAAIYAAGLELTAKQWEELYHKAEAKLTAVGELVVEWQFFVGKRACANELAAVLKAGD